MRCQLCILGHGAVIARNWGDCLAPRDPTQPNDTISSSTFPGQAAADLRPQSKARGLPGELCRQRAGLRPPWLHQVQAGAGSVSWQMDSATPQSLAKAWWVCKGHLGGGLPLLEAISGKHVLVLGGPGFDHRVGCSQAAHRPSVEASCGFRKLI